MQALYDGKVMGESYLGSIVAESPADWIAEDDKGDGVVNDLVIQAIDEARTEAVRMLEILKEDFLQ